MANPRSSASNPPAVGPFPPRIPRLPKNSLEEQGRTDAMILVHAHRLSPPTGVKGKRGSKLVVLVSHLDLIGANGRIWHRPPEPGRI